MVDNPVKWGREGVCYNCGAPIMYRIVGRSTQGAYYTSVAYDMAGTMGRHQCPPYPEIDWHACRNCDAPVFEIEGACYQDVLGKLPHRCRPATPQLLLPTARKEPPPREAPGGWRGAVRL